MQIYSFETSESVSDQRQREQWSDEETCVENTGVI